MSETSAKPRLTNEQRRRGWDLGDPYGEYVDDDPRKYGYYNIGATGYIGPRKRPYREPDDDERTMTGILADPAEPWEPYSLGVGGYARIDHPELLSTSYDPIEIAERGEFEARLKRRNERREKVGFVLFTILVLPFFPFILLFEWIGGLREKRRS